MKGVVNPVLNSRATVSEGSLVGVPGIILNVALSSMPSFCCLYCVLLRKHVHRVLLLSLTA